ncbi:MAG TPA: hypothetical protein PLM75_04830 [bacterium]|nr:hypothetical protein [bacterium]
MRLMLIRYHSRYSKFIKHLLEEYNIDDYVFTSDVSFLEQHFKATSGHNLLKSQAWPEGNEIIIKAVEDTVSDEIFDKIVKYKAENNITNKLKILLVPLAKNG